MTTKPEVFFGVSPDGIPLELKKLDRWVLWKFTQDSKTDKWGKVPYQCSGRKASSTDSSTWNTFDGVMLCADKYDGIGFVFNGDGIVGVDLDDVVEDGMWSDKASAILEAVPGYAEFSPSGTGLHIITRSSSVVNKSKDGVEVYSTDRYFTFTGQGLSTHREIQKASKNLDSFIDKYFDTPAKITRGDDDLSQALHKHPLGRSIDEIKKSLALIEPPSDEPSCTPYIWAIHHETSGSEEGLALAHSWCSGGLHDTEYPEYDHDYVEERWERAKDNKGNAKTWRSVEREAKKNEKLLPTENDKDFRFYDGDEYASNFALASEIVEDVFPDRGIVMLYGPSGVGKTFWVLDMAFHIQNGIKWRDKDVQAGDVMYIAAEAGRGIKKRIKAVKSVHPDWKAPYVADLAPDLASAVSLEAVRDAALAAGNPSVVIIDTMSASFTGDDSSQQDISGMIRNLKALSDALECLVVFIHHSTKEGSSWRGSGALLNDSDAVLEFVLEFSEGNEGNERRQWVTQKKHREGESGKSYPFSLVVSDPLAYKENGKPVTSCTIEQTDHEITQTKKRTPKSIFDISDKYAVARSYLGVIQDEAGLGGANIEEKDIIDAIQEKFGGGFEDSPPKKNIKRTLVTLANLGKIHQEGRWIKLV